MATEFLDSRFSITQKITDLFQDSADVFCIVAFWGKGALQIFSGMDEQSLRQVKIVCNLSTGSTNPRTIEELITKNVEVRQNSTLHSKVYWTGRGVIVGSANASANGLSLESVAQDGWLEAAIYSNEKFMVSRVRSYVDKIWCTACQITSEDLEKAKSAWRRRRSFPRPDPRLGFWDALRNGMFTDRATDVYISLDVGDANQYEDDIQRQGDGLKGQYIELEGREIGAWAWNDGFRLEREVYVISFSLGPRRGVGYTRIWKTLPENCDREGEANADVTYQYAYAVQDEEIGMTGQQRNDLIGLIRHLAVNHGPELDENLSENGAYIRLERLLDAHLQEIVDGYFGAPQ